MQHQPEKKFDFAEAAARSYGFLWRERSLVLQLSLLPFVIKLVSFMFIVALDLDRNFLRQGLILVPSFFAEGWLIARLIRISLFGRESEPQLTGNPREDYHRFQDYTRLLLSSTLAYVLIKLFLSFFIALFFGQAETYTPDQTPEAGAPALFVAVVMVGVSVWAFRFFWLNIPVVLGYDLESFLKKTRSFMTSVHMLAVWLLCCVPVLGGLLLVVQLLSILIPDTQSDLFSYVTTGVQSLMELVRMMVCNIAMASMIRWLYEEKAP